MSETAVHIPIAGVEEPEAGRPSRARTRSCVGCGERVDLLGEAAGDLIRFVFGPDGSVAVSAVDAGRGSRAAGRGGHVHARGPCLERAVKGGLARSARGRITTVLDEENADPLSAGALARAIQRSLARRIEGFVATGVRSRQLVSGADAVTSACTRGEAALLMVACDAASAPAPAPMAAAELTEVRRAIAEGRAVAWGSERRLGARIVAITSRPLAEALRRTVRIADACAAIASGSVSERTERAGASTGTPRKRRGQRAFPRVTADHAKNHRSDG